MFSAPNERSVPSLPSQTEAETLGSADPGLVQSLFQDNQILRAQIAHHHQLLQLLTHQLATPLTSLSGSVHLLAEPELQQNDRQEFLGMVQQQIGRLQDLLADLMALRDLETGKLETRRSQFAVVPLLQEVIADYPAQPFDCEFEADLPLVWGDRWQIAQVLVNLISNAMKYSPPGRVIQLGAKRHQGGVVEVWVKDHGLGIPIADQPHLFERFYRVKHRDRENISGTGLGLSLCKMLVENQGGQIGFESAHGQGSRFYFTLPTEPVHFPELAPDCGAQDALPPD
mgnify:CR=1 FL=1